MFMVMCIVMEINSFESMTLRSSLVLLFYTHIESNIFYITFYFNRILNKDIG